MNPYFAPNAGVLSSERIDVLAILLSSIEISLASK